jgi:hypothetical protein
MRFINDLHGKPKEFFVNIFSICCSFRPMSSAGNAVVRDVVDKKKK